MFHVLLVLFSQTRLSWEGEAIKTEGKKTYYKSVSINEELVTVSDFVAVKPDDPTIPLYVARVMYMWENGSGEKWFHAHWYK